MLTPLRLESIISKRNIDSSKLDEMKIKINVLKAFVEQKAEEGREAAEETKGQVAEGVVSSQSVAELARKVGVEMPITDAVVEICHNGEDAKAALQQLLGRSRKSEL